MFSAIQHDDGHITACYVEWLEKVEVLKVEIINLTGHVRDEHVITTYPMTGRWDFTLPASAPDDIITAVCFDLLGMCLKEDDMNPPSAGPSTSSTTSQKKATPATEMSGDGLKGTTFDILLLIVSSLRISEMFSSTG